MSKPESVQDLGVLTEGIYFTVNAGTGEYRGHKLSLGATIGQGEPIIYANKKTFRLRWEDIIWIAEQRGMFEATDS